MRKPYALIIEDDPKLGIIFQMALEEAGFETDIDATGKQYRARLLSATPHLIVLDIHLPYASGKEILEEIRSEGRLTNSMVIVTTADLFFAKGMEKLADHVLLKPVSVRRLLGLIADRWPNGIDSPASPAEKEPT